MAHLRCDKCGGPTSAFGSWDTEIKILCEECSGQIKRRPIEQIREDLAILSIMNKVRKKLNKLNARS